MNELSGLQGLFALIGLTLALAITPLAIKLYMMPDPKEKADHSIKPEKPESE